MYLTYTEYQNMGGALDETTFIDLELDAENCINWYTFGRLKKQTEIPDEVKKCICRIISLLQMKNNTLAVPNATSGQSSAQIASQSNDGVSVTYNVLSVKDVSSTVESEIENTINKYLAYTVDSLGRKLLYRGLYPNE